LVSLGDSYRLKFFAYLKHIQLFFFVLISISYKNTKYFVNIFQKNSLLLQ